MNLITDAQVRQFHEQGYFVTEPMFQPPQLAAMVAEFERLHQQRIDEAQGTGDPARVDLARYRAFIGQVHTHSSVAADFVRAPIYLEACARFIGPDADLYYNQAVIKPPEKGMHFAWHQDSGYRVTRPLEYITCWTAITRTFVANGCIWVIPGSHKQGLIDNPMDEQQRMRVATVDESGAIPVEMQPGQVAIFSSLLLHKSGPNTSREVRHGYVPQYHHADVVDAKTGQPWGDRYPVLRGGKAVS
jgi:ectoine hydroxylase-related dioxygenase (phytanoyl-CoA dioxygenase family)